MGGSCPFSNQNRFQEVEYFTKIEKSKKRPDVEEPVLRHRPMHPTETRGTGRAQRGGPQPTPRSGASAHGAGPDPWLWGQWDVRVGVGLATGQL